MLWNKKDGGSSLPDLPPAIGLKSRIGNLPTNEVSTNPVSLAPNELLNKPAIDESEDENEDSQSHALPSFPDSPIKKGFAQAAIKEAISGVSDGSMQPSMMPSAVVSNDSSLHEVEITPSPVVATPSGKFKTIEVTDNSSEVTAPNGSNSSKPSGMYSQTIASQPIKPIANEERSEKDARIAPMPSITRREETKKITFVPAKKKSESKSENIFVKIDKFYSAKKALETTREQLNQIEDLLKKIRETKLREEQELENWERELLLAKSSIQEVNENIFEKLE